MLCQVLLFDGCDELDAIAPYEVLCQAAAWRPGWRVELVALRGPKKVLAHHGTRLWAPGRLGPLKGKKRPDVVIVPGGGWLDGSPAGARAEVAKGKLPAALAQLHAAGTVVCSVCTGAMILAAAGLLMGRRAITHHSALEDLRATGAKIVRKRVVDAGDIVTAGGVTSGLDLALHLVKRFGSAKLAREVAASLEYVPR